MNAMTSLIHFDWYCRSGWKKSAGNTAWCLLGCSLGDNVTVLGFQYYAPHTAMLIVMVAAMLMGLATSISLETVIMSRQLPLKEAVKVAFGMSFVSMLMMETAINLTSIAFADGNRLALSWWSLVPSWMMGFLTAWVYNYYKIKKYGKSCHGH